MKRFDIWDVTYIISLVIGLMLIFNWLINQASPTPPQQKPRIDTIYIATPDTIDLGDGWVLYHNNKPIRRFK